MTNAQGHLAFKVLHAVYHERDFRVRVNDPTVNFVRRNLATLVGEDKLGEEALLACRAKSECPACAAGFDPFEEQPNAADRR